MVKTFFTMYPSELRYTETHSNIQEKAVSISNQKPIGSVPAYWAQCTLPPQPILPDLPLRFFEGQVPRLVKTRKGTQCYNYPQFFFYKNRLYICFKLWLRDYLGLPK